MLNQKIKKGQLNRKRTEKTKIKGGIDRDRDPGLAQDQDPKKGVDKVVSNNRDMAKLIMEMVKIKQRKFYRKNREKRKYNKTLMIKRIENKLILIVISTLHNLTNLIGKRTSRYLNNKNRVKDNKQFQKRRQ